MLVALWFDLHLFALLPFSLRPGGQHPNRCGLSVAPWNIPHRCAKYIKTPKNDAGVPEGFR